MPEPQSDTDAQRFRWTALCVLAGTGALIAVYLVGRGAGGIPPLLLAAVSVYISKLLIFGGVAEVGAFNPWELGLIAWVLDLLVCVGLLASFQSFARLPLAGDAVRQGHSRAADALRDFPGIRRMAVAGIAIFVFLPLPASGAFVGTLLARLIGLTRMATFLSVAAGAGLAVVVYAAVAVLGKQQWRSLLESPSIVIACAVFLVAFTWFAWLRVKRELRRH